jgi:hypothetical protein
VSRVLLVTIILTGRTGTEVVCCETARGLRKRNHDVAIYTQQDGPTADQLRAEGFQVTTDLASLTFVPDVIQANQTYPLLEAIGRFPATPAISICHDSTIWYNEPVDLPSVRHLAVDPACRDRITSRFAHLAERVEILHNAVDLDAFRPRSPLPRRPKRALILAKHPSYLEAVRAACSQRGLDVDVVGPAVGNIVDDLPSCFRDYDLVFASARTAIEALAAGCAVIVVDSRGVAGLVTHSAVSSWRENNFGRRLFSRPASSEVIVAEIDRYDAEDAQLVSRFIRENSSLDGYLDRLEIIHREAIAESAANPVDTGELLHCMSRSFRTLAEAWRTQKEADFENFARSKHEELAGFFLERAHAEQAKLSAIFEQRLRAQEAEWTAAIEQRLRAQEAELSAIFAQRLHAQDAELSAMFEQRLRAQEAKLRAAFQQQANLTEAEYQEQARAVAVEFQRQASIKDAEFAAFRAWVAPRNLHRRILHKLRRGLFKS